MANALLYYLIVINIVTFLVYGMDKLKAKQGSWRISEATLLILAIIGGSIGALLGMKVWRHKTQHKKFKYGLPLILLAQIAPYLPVLQLSASFQRLTDRELKEVVLRSRGVSPFAYHLI